MNTQMAYLLGMILGNGEIQRGSNRTTVTIDIPHKNLYDDEGRDAAVYVKASLADIRQTIEPLLGLKVPISTNRRSTMISFSKPNEDYTMRELLRLIGSGTRHSVMTMNPELFGMSRDERTELLRGFADVTGYIRRSNQAYGGDCAHRVYIEIPGNWYMVIDIANMLKELDVPVQTIDFGHPNFRDSQLRKYNAGNQYYWKKEHQVKIWANEFLPIGFNIIHKQHALEKYADELLDVMPPTVTHKFYWEKAIRRRSKPVHPMEDDPSLPPEIRGRHYESRADLANDLGYHA